MTEDRLAPKLPCPACGVPHPYGDACDPGDDKSRPTPSSILREAAGVVVLVADEVSKLEALVDRMIEAWEGDEDLEAGARLRGSVDRLAEQVERIGARRK